MFAESGNSRCPVEAYKGFRQRRPSSSLDPDSPFYLRISRHEAAGDIWYVNQAMGKNIIGSLVKTMCEEAGITGRKVNHSARKTAITSLVHAGVAPTLVMQLSGHKNVNSINNYSSASFNQQKEMSSILTDFNKPQSSIHSNVEVIPEPIENTLDPVSDVVRSSQEMVEESLRAISSYENVDAKPQPNIIMQDLNLDANSLMKSMSQHFLSGARVTGNVIFQFGNATEERKENLNPVKRRRIIYSDCDSD